MYSYISESIPLKLCPSTIIFLISFNFCSRHSWPLLWYSIFITLLKTTDSKHRHVSEWLLYVMTALHCVLPFSFSEKNLLFIFLVFRMSYFFWDVSFFHSRSRHQRNPLYPHLQHSQRQSVLSWSSWSSSWLPSSCSSLMTYPVLVNSCYYASSAWLS